MNEKAAWNGTRGEPPPEATDDLDRLLMRLPGEAPPASLESRIMREMRASRLRTTRLRTALSAALAICGFWLVWPLLDLGIQALAARSMALTSALDWYGVASQDMLGFLSGVSGNLVSFQEGFAGSLGTPTWAGLLVLALGALLAIGQMLPRGGDDNEFRRET